MPDYLGDDQRKTKEEDKDDSPIRGKTAYDDVLNERSGLVSRLAHANPALQQTCASY